MIFILLTLILPVPALLLTYWHTLKSHQVRQELMIIAIGLFIHIGHRMYYSAILVDNGILDVHSLPIWLIVIPYGLLICQGLLNTYKANS